MRDLNVLSVLHFSGLPRLSIDPLPMQTRVVDTLLPILQIVPFSEIFFPVTIIN
jgi:hypothetical protein